jgi:2-polyprenyl-3-methyl-5-hydroxy-6-metoxy-1,4-benzoquinol methylase
LHERKGGKSRFLFIEPPPRRARPTQEPETTRNAHVAFFARQPGRQIVAADYVLNPLEAWTLHQLIGRVLDLGCGFGDLSLGAAGAGHAVDAIDARPQAVGDLAMRAGFWE